VAVSQGWNDEQINCQELIPSIVRSGISSITLHGRTRQQRYTRKADYSYIKQTAKVASKYNMPVVANGDIFSYRDYQDLINPESHVAAVMVGRAAIIKPWIFTEIKEQKDWDISATERLDMLKQYVQFGLEHFGSDTKGIENTRRFLLEFLSFTCRYVPVGLLEQGVKQSVNLRAPQFVARNDLEQLLSSHYVEDWIKLSELLICPRPANFQFLPKHKSNSYADEQNG
jgi:tRNA-dihydrouridine synthase 3